MERNFKTREEAKYFIDDFVKHFTREQPRVFTTLDDKIFSQEHSSYFDHPGNTHYDVALLEFAEKFQVTIRATPYSRLVQAADSGNLELFEREMGKEPSSKALALAFVTAIQKEHLPILDFMYSNGHVDGLDLFKDPLVTASRNDKVESFRFILKRSPRLPAEILGPIFHDSSHEVMSCILEDKKFSEEIKKQEYLTSWATSALEKHDNEATRLFKIHVKS